MSRRKKVWRNLIVLAILFIIFIKGSGLHLNPLKAHEESERSIHYGPSKVVHVQDFPGGKYILGKYDKWVSCNTVNRALFFFWRFGDQPVGFENEKDKAIDYTWGGSYERYRLYGIINDPKVKKVQLTLKGGQTFTQKEFYDGDMFLFTWEQNSKQDIVLDNIKAYDKDDNVIFKSEY